MKEYICYTIVKVKTPLNYMNKCHKQNYGRRKPHCPLFNVENKRVIMPLEIRIVITFKGEKVDFHNAGKAPFLDPSKGYISLFIL